MAIHVFQMSSFDTGPDNTDVEFLPICGGSRTGSGTAYGTEAEAQLVVRAAHTWQYASAQFTTISGATANINARVDGVDDTSLNLSTSSTGRVEDNVGSIVLADGEAINWEFGGGDGHGDQLQISTINTELDITNASDGIPMAVFTDNPASIASGSADLFHAFGGADLEDQESTEANVQYTFRTAQDVANLRVYAKAVTNGASVIVARVSGVDDTDLTVSVSGTGVTEDLTGVAEYAVADEANWDTNPGGSMNNLEMNSIQCTLETAHVRPLIVSGRIAQSASTFTGLEGAGRDNTPEADFELEFNNAATLQNLFVFVTTGSASSSVELRVNRVDDTTLQVATTSAGIVEDLVGSVDFSANDEGNWTHTGNAGLSIIAVENDVDVPAVPHGFFRPGSVPGMRYYLGNAPQLGRTW